MAEHDGHLIEVVDGYAKVLQEKNVAMDKHQPYLVRWVWEFLRFARARAGYSFEQTLDLFLAEVGGRVGTKRWQLQQASDGIPIYRYQYRRADAGDGDAPTAQAFVDDAARLERLAQMREWHEASLANGYGEAPLPDALARKDPNAGRQWGWQYVFPAEKVPAESGSGDSRGGGGQGPLAINPPR